MNQLGSGEDCEALHMMEETSEGVILRLRVKPSSSHFRLEPRPDGELVMELKAPAERNEANMELLKRLKAIFRRDVSLLRGHRGRTKTVLIRGADIKEIKDKL